MTLLTTKTAYRITIFNANTLGHITGLGSQTMLANLGWFATYDENRYPRWAIVPRSVVENELLDFEMEEDGWHR